MSSVNLGVNEVILGDDLQNQAAEYRLDYAITTLGAARAVIGAQTVSLQEAANVGNVASVNTQASESAIRDLNVGATVTALTRDQIVVQFQTKLIADARHALAGRRDAGVRLDRRRPADRAERGRHVPLQREIGLSRCTGGGIVGTMLFCCGS